MDLVVKQGRTYKASHMLHIGLKPLGELFCFALGHGRVIKEVEADQLFRVEIHAFPSPSRRLTQSRKAIRIRWSVTNTLSCGSRKDVVIILLSLILGALTHIVWDSCTHWYGWSVQHISLEYRPEIPQHGMISHQNKVKQSIVIITYSYKMYSVIEFMNKWWGMWSKVLQIGGCLTMR